MENDWVNVKKVNFVFSLVFIAIFFTYIAYVNLNRPRIYVIYSFDEDFVWEKNIELGLKKVFEKHINYLTRKFYLRTQYVADEKNESKMSARAVYLIQQWKPDVVVLVDDKAQKLVGSHLINNPKIKVVFASVAAPIQDYHYRLAKNVTGVKQELPLESFEAMVDKISPSRPKTFTYLYDKEYSSWVFRDQLKNHKWRDLQIVNYVQCDDIKGLTKAIKEAEKNSSYLLVSIFSAIKKDDTSKRFLTINEVNEWLAKNSPIPLFSLAERMGPITFGNSPLEQGLNAGDIIEKIVTYNIPISKIPIRTSKWFTIVINKRQCKEYDINIPEIYYNFAHVTDTLFYH